MQAAFFIVPFLLTVQVGTHRATPDQIRQWAEKLGDDSAQVRDEATRRLIEAGSAAVEELRKRTESGDAEIKWRAERILGAIENERRLKAIVRRTIFLDKEKKVKLDLVWIKPGKFTMGEGGDAHLVLLRNIGHA